MFYFDESTSSFYAEGTQPHGAYLLTSEEHSALYDEMARGKKVVIVDGRPQAVEPEPAVVTTAELKKIVTRYRKSVEAGGITLPSGVRVATGVEDQNRITSVLSRPRGIEEFDFKAESGWVTVTFAELDAIDKAIAVHVQGCFTAERRHHEAIDAIEKIEDPVARQAALDGYDESQGWPGEAA